MSIRKWWYYLTHWETWDYRVKLVPLIPIWCWHCLRSRSWWFFTAANPSLTFGGFQGEGKREMYEQLPPGTYPRSLYITPSLPVEEAEEQVTIHKYTYPFAVKPDVGMMGLLFRRIDSIDAFRQYHRAVPVDYVVQEFINYPIEVSVFYYRFPGESTGTITGFVRKEFLEVVGDGQSTLWTLMRRYERVDFRLDEMRAKHADQLDYVVPDGETYCLNYALNLTRGGRLVSLAHEKDAQLLRVFDELSHYTKHFYFGRYDIKCRSIAELKQGKEFTIIEFNGAGAAPHHVYGNGNSLRQAYRIVLHHWDVLYRISRDNRRRGEPRWTFRRGWQFLKESELHIQKLRRLERQLTDAPGRYELSERTVG
ncbi:MAG: hypothetical protein H7Z72_01035 [Bacteroidetes bacterium]|nr:hypothetical protein [Fibrella sp.]